MTPNRFPDCLQGGWATQSAPCYGHFLQQLLLLNVQSRLHLLQHNALGLELPVLQNQCWLRCQSSANLASKIAFACKAGNFARFAQAVAGWCPTPIPHLLPVGVQLPTRQRSSGALAAAAAAKTTHRHVNLSWLVTRKKAGLLQPLASNTRTTPATPALVQMKRE